MQKSIWLFAAILISTSCSQQKPAVTQAVDLQCEYQTEPIGVDAEAPRFSRTLSDPGQVRGQAQTAYNILVASSFDKLTEAAADIWNSGKVDFAEASVGSPYGEIVSRWERKDSNITLSVTAPPNTTATVYVPARHAEGITESGHSLNVAEGVVFKSAENGYAVIEVTSGKYELVSPLNN